MKKGKTKDDNPQVRFTFDLEHKARHYHFPVMELWTNYKASFMVGHEGGWVNFHWDGENWKHEMKDAQLAKLVIENLVIGYESKICSPDL